MILRDQGVAMSKGPKRKFTGEYKEEALKLWEANSWRNKQTAEQLGINPQLLPRWQRQLQRADRSHPASAGQPVVGSEAAEIARLKRELERVKMEHEILKKTVAIFSGSRK
jgi:transposase